MASRVRGWGGVAALLVAALLVPLALIATWTSRTVTDTEVFVSRLGPVASDPHVQTFVQTQLSDAINTAVLEDGLGPRVDSAVDSLDVPDPVKSLLRDLAAAAGSAISTRIDGLVDRVVRAPEFQSAFDAALTSSHGELVKALDGEDPSDTLVTEGDVVSIRLATIGNAVRTELVGAGFSFAERLPEIEATIPITSSEKLDQLRTYYGALKVLVWLGPLLVVLLAGLGVWLVRDLVVAGLWFFAGSVTFVLVLTLGIRAGVASAVGGIRDPDAAAAAQAIISTLTRDLASNARFTVVLALLGVLVCAALMVRRAGTRVSPRSPWTSVPPRPAADGAASSSAAR